MARSEASQPHVGEQYLRPVRICDQRPSFLFPFSNVIAAAPGSVMQMMGDVDSEVNDINRSEMDVEGAAATAGPVSKFLGLRYGGGSATNTPISFDSKTASSLEGANSLTSGSTSDLSVVNSSGPALTMSASDSCASPSPNKLKPKQSFIAMITMAIRSAPDQRATLSQIYNYIKQQFPFYASETSNWQNSIRHNLSLNACFVKVNRNQEDPGKGSYWMIHPEHNDMFRNGYMERRKKRVKKVPKRPRPQRRFAGLSKEAIAQIAGNHQQQPQQHIYNTEMLLGQANLSLNTLAEASYHRSQELAASRQQQENGSSSKSSPLTPPVSPALMQRAKAVVQQPLTSAAQLLQQGTRYFQFPGGSPSQPSLSSFSTSMNSSSSSPYSVPSLLSASPPAMPTVSSPSRVTIQYVIPTPGGYLRAPPAAAMVPVTTWQTAPAPAAAPATFTYPLGTMGHLPAAQNPPVFFSVPTTQYQ